VICLGVWFVRIRLALFGLRPSVLAVLSICVFPLSVQKKLSGQETDVDIVDGAEM
jgi:hypothetical protein